MFLTMKYGGVIYVSFFFTCYVFFFLLIFAAEKKAFLYFIHFLHPKSVAVTCGANSYYFTGYKGTVLELLAVFEFLLRF